MSEGALLSFRRYLLLGLAAVVLVVGLFWGWFFTRPVTPGEFIVRVVPSGAGPEGLLLTLQGPGGGKLGEWRFQGVPSSAVLAGMEKKVPWTAVATNARTGHPCLTIEVAPFVREAAITPVEELVRSQCCAGAKAAAVCPIRRVVLR